MRRVSCAAKEAHRHFALLDVARLAHLAAVHPDEVGRLAGKRHRVRLAGVKRRVGRACERIEMRFHARPARQSSPPNTSTPVKTHAGDAWPTRMLCPGSPLPQNGVPSTRTVSALPTRARLRQNFALMPR